MLRGIDGVHTWTSPDAVTLRLNELDDISTGAPKWPRYRLLDVDHGYPEAGATAHKRIGQAGAVAHPDYRGSRTHTYTIEVMGRTIDELRQAEEDLEAAFYDQSAEGRMDIGTHPLNPDYSADNDRYFEAKAGHLMPGTNAPDSDLSPELGFRREWALSLRNHEGVYYQELTPDTFKQAIIDLEPSLYWALDADDGVTDLSGNGRDGFAGGSIAVGASAALTSIVGDSATNFDGTDDFVSSQWDPWDPAGERTVILFLVRDTSASADVILGSSDNDVRVQFSSGSNNITWQGDAITGAETTWAGPAPTQSAFLALTVKDEYPSPSDAEVSLFLDGVLVSTEAVDDLSPASNFVVGESAGASAPFDGKMSHVAAFQRVLRAQEIASVYGWATTGIRSYH